MPRTFFVPLTHSDFHANSVFLRFINTTAMKIAFFLFLSGLSSTAFGNTPLPGESGIIVSRFYEPNGILVWQSEGIFVYADAYELDGAHYASLTFVNTGTQDVRLLWSVARNAVPQIIQMDGTVEAYLNLPAGSEYVFGLPDSEDPLLRIDSEYPENELQLTIQLK